MSSKFCWFQGLLKIGDVILEVNSRPVSTPEGLQTEIAKARDNLQLKVGSPTTEKPILSGRQVSEDPFPFISGGFGSGSC
jgi:hypothetical protein